MAQPIRLLYISISGNTKNFVQDLQEYAHDQHEKDPSEPLIELKEISDATVPAEESKNFFAFVPTYLTGGNGIDNGVTELMTNALGEYIEFGQNRDFCIGIVGSGNRNFNEQYCLTAKRYANEFNTEMIADYELRGTPSDVKSIYTILKTNNH